ncbi:MAG: SCO family protein, partial [Anaerolineae bacterium]|nr:SCO family protein [Anaerolineae bacterium]
MKALKGFKSTSSHSLVISLLLLTLLSTWLSGPVQAQGVVSDKDKALLDSIGYDQRLDEQVPLDLTFTDDSGRLVQLGDYFDNKPVILVMAYYECPMLCTLVLNGLLNSLEAIDFDLGDQFEVVTISMDPGETAAMAAAKKETYIKFYARPGAADGWHFLTGSAEAIKGVTEAIGFRYVYDERLDEYAHATGMVLLTPEGRISRYFYGIEFDPTDVRLGLVEASNNQIGSAIDQVLLMCYKYDP